MLDTRVGQVYYWSLPAELWVVVATYKLPHSLRHWEMRSLETPGGPVWFTDSEIEQMMSRFA